MHARSPKEVHFCFTVPPKRLSSERKFKRVMRLLKTLLFILTVSCLMTVLIGSALASTESINVQPGKEITITRDLAAGDRSSITFTVTGPDPCTLHFYIIFSNGTTTDYGKTGRCTIEFFADAKGECQLHFDNTDSQNAQMVTLNYEVEHYIFGIPQMFFLLLAIAALLLVVVAGYIIMGKYG